MDMETLKQWTQGILKLQGFENSLCEAYTESEGFRRIANWLLKGDELLGIECEADFEEVYGKRLL